MVNLGGCGAARKVPVGPAPEPARILACHEAGLRVLDYVDHVVVRGLGLELQTQNRWRDAEGRHYGVWLRLPDGQPASIELIFRDAEPGTVIARLFRLEKGQSFDLVATPDGVWRMLGNPTAEVACGTLTPANEALVRWLDGGPSDEKMVGLALREARRRYQDER